MINFPINWLQSGKIQYLLNLLGTREDLDSLEQLAIVTKVRQEMSTKDLKPDIKNIIAKTNILSIVQQILGFADNLNPNIRYLKVSFYSHQICIAWGDMDPHEYWLWRWRWHSGNFRQEIWHNKLNKFDIARKWSLNDRSVHLALCQLCWWVSEASQHDPLRNVHNRGHEPNSIWGREEQGFNPEGDPLEHDVVC